jgi:hypothetical protein
MKFERKKFVRSFENFNAVFFVEREEHVLLLGGIQDVKKFFGAKIEF